MWNVSASYAAEMTNHRTSPVVHFGVFFIIVTEWLRWLHLGNQGSKNNYVGTAGLSVSIVPVCLTKY